MLVNGKKDNRIQEDYEGDFPTYRSSMKRDQSLGEEIANSISHGIGFLGAAAVTPVLIVTAVPAGGAAIVGASIFGTTMMVLYLASTLYHAFPQSRVKRVFQILDHGAIYVLIAGTGFIE